MKKNCGSTMPKSKNRKGINMKKIFAMLLALSLLLAACGSKAPVQTQPKVETPAETQAPVETKAPAAQETTPAESQTAEKAVINNRDYSYVMDGITLTPGAAYDAAAMPTAEALYQIPSCAFEGTDNVYTYPGCEIIAYNEGQGEVIYSIYLLDPAVMTPEGLAVGDEEAKIAGLYGNGYTLTDGQYVYQGRNSQLIVLTGHGYVVSIEMRIPD